MILSLFMQTELLVYSIAAGMLTGLIFDFYRTFRGFEKINKVFIIIEDVLFWILTSIVIFIFLLFTNQAVIGLYVYVWMAVGIYIYLKLISSYFTKMQYNLICWLSKLWRLILNIVLYPLRIIIYGLSTKNKRN